MENTTYIALSRQMAIQRQSEMTANNLANMNTPAYQGSKMLFVDYLVDSQTVEKKFGEKLSFVQDIGMMRNTDEGPFVATDNRMDFAIQGDGYFVMDTPLGERYTRNGRFTVGADGNLVNSQGYRVKGVGTESIAIPANAEQLEVTPDGTVRAKIITPEGSQPVTVIIGQIRVADFENQQEMTYAGEGLLRANAGSVPEAAENAAILQGMIENSNVNPINEITGMITAVRAYTSNQKIMEDEHERMRRAYQVLTREN